MITETIKSLDELTVLIKDKGSEERLYEFKKFDFYLLLCMEIIRYELLTRKELSDKSAEAITQLFTFQAFEYYYKEHPDIYSRFSIAMKLLGTYNAKLVSYDIGALGVKDKSWKDYFTTAIKKLIDENAPHNH